MLVRKAIKEDLIAVCELAHQVNKQHHEHVPALFSKPIDALEDSDFWLTKIENEEILTLVAESDENIQGFVLASLTNYPIVPFLARNRVCRISTIVVSEAKQQLGIGEQLIMEVECWAKEQGVTEIRLEVVEFNEGAQHFYAKQGFHTQSRILSKALL